MTNHRRLILAAAMGGLMSVPAFAAQPVPAAATPTATAAATADKAPIKAPAKTVVHKSVAAQGKKHAAKPTAKKNKEIAQPTRKG
jgi:hypothetical protein